MLRDWLAAAFLYCVLRIVLRLVSVAVLWFALPAVGYALLLPAVGSALVLPAVGFALLPAVGFALLGSFHHFSPALGYALLAHLGFTVMPVPFSSFDSAGRFARVLRTCSSVFFLLTRNRSLSIVVHRPSYFFDFVLRSAIWRCLFSYSGHHWRLVVVLSLFSV